jgi:hypothetical protein
MDGNAKQPSVYTPLPQQRARLARLGVSKIILINVVKHASAASMLRRLASLQAPSCVGSRNVDATSVAPSLSFSLHFHPRSTPPRRHKSQTVNISNSTSTHAEADSPTHNALDATHRPSAAKPATGDRPRPTTHDPPRTSSRGARILRPTGVISRSRSLQFCRSSRRVVCHEIGFPRFPPCQIPNPGQWTLKHGPDWSRRPGWRVACGWAVRCGGIVGSGGGRRGTGTPLVVIGMRVSNV